MPMEKVQDLIRQISDLFSQQTPEHGQYMFLLIGDANEKSDSSFSVVEVSGISFKAAEGSLLEALLRAHQIWRMENPDAGNEPTTKLKYDE